MPIDEDIQKILLIGSGPIEIGQAAEFDYSGSQACKALREEGIEVVLVNSNPATIMTDPSMADKVYVEPLEPEYLENIIEEERPDGIAAGLGGQTGLNLTSELAERGVLDRYDVDVLGCSLDTIETTEDRELFKEAMHEMDEEVAHSTPVSSVEEAEAFVEEVGFPVVIRPAYTLGGTGGGIAHDEEELERIANKGMTRSRIGQVLVEEYLGGWKEFEYEVMRDANDTAITVVNMENVDPMGVHTGDSSVVAPSQTLTDEEHHMLRTAALKIIRGLDIEGGCNIQFAVNPENGEYRVIEVNPRVSRSSALASKATGYPIARVAAKIAIGKDLHEIENDITGKTVAAFEPMIDYTVVKIPRWPFEKFHNVEDSLTTQMKGTGEAMAIGRTLEEAFQKAVRSLDLNGVDRFTDIDYEDRIDDPNSLRLLALYSALKDGKTVEELADRTGIDPFFIHKIQNVVDTEDDLDMGGDAVQKAKQNGFTDAHIADVTEGTVDAVQDIRDAHDILPTYRMVDTCAGEFTAETPFYYAAFEQNNEVEPSDEETVVILGGGPIRIGQGIEFDYSCVHAVEGVNDEGAHAVIINNNPETVSTDYDVSDTLFFEPLTAEDVANVVEVVGADRVVTQFGGQTSVDVTVPLQELLDARSMDAGVVGTSPGDMDAIEDRHKFDSTMKELGIQIPESGTAASLQEAKQVADRIGYPLLVRPSYVIGGRAMRIVENADNLEEYMEEAVNVSQERPVLLDQFLDGAIELDIDAVADGDDVLIGGVMEHIEPAGVHSGDSACVIPTQTVSGDAVETAKTYVRKIAEAFDIVGFLNVQLAVQDGEVYVLEANPRASRTVPYVSKHTGIPLARIATRTIMGTSLDEIREEMDLDPSFSDRVSVKEVVFPFGKFEDIDMNLGPEMKSTGEVMGVADSFGEAYYKAQDAAGNPLPLKGTVMLAGDVPQDTIGRLQDLGLGIERSEDPEKVTDHDLLIDLTGTNELKRNAVNHDVPYLSTEEALDASIHAIDAMKEKETRVSPLT